MVSKMSKRRMKRAFCCLSLSLSLIFSLLPHLRAVRVGPGVGHREDPGARVAQVEVLVGELGTIDRLAAAAVAPGEVAALAHERGDDAVEARADEALAFCREFFFVLLFYLFFSCQVFGLSGTRNRNQKLNNSLPGRVASSAKLVAVRGTMSSLTSKTTRPRGVAASPRPSWRSK